MAFLLPMARFFVPIGGYFLYGATDTEFGDPKAVKSYAGDWSPDESDRWMLYGKPWSKNSVSSIFFGVQTFLIHGTSIDLVEKVSKEIANGRPTVSNLSCFNGSAVFGGRNKDGFLYISEYQGKFFGCKKSGSGFVATPVESGFLHAMYVNVWTKNEGVNKRPILGRSSAK